MNPLVPISVAARLALVAAIGQDAVQAIMAAAFSAVRDDADNMVPELIADDAWAAPGWREAALEYHKARDGRVSIVPYAPEHVARLRRLMDDSISLDRAWHELHGRRSGATASTVEALVFGLRDGLAALPKNPDRLRPLSELNAEQLKAVCRRVQNFNPEIATLWSSDDVAALITKWRELHARR
jgi:hypothetical protein